MKQTLKKLLSLTLAGAMMFSMGITAFASEKSPARANTPQILIQQDVKTYIDENGDMVTETLKVYQDAISPRSTAKKKYAEKSLVINSDINASIITITLDADFHYDTTGATVTSDRYYSSYDNIHSAVKSYEESSMDYSENNGGAVGSATVKTKYKVVEIRSSVTGNTMTYNKSLSLKCTSMGYVS